MTLIVKREIVNVTSKMKLSTVGDTATRFQLEKSNSLEEKNVCAQ